MLLVLLPSTCRLQHCLLSLPPVSLLLLLTVVLSPQALVMKALVGLCTVLYKSFPTSIQQDKATLASLQDGQQQQPDTALSQERLLTAVQFRLGPKLLLERSTKQLIQRLQELAAKQ